MRTILVVVIVAVLSACASTTTTQRTEDDLASARATGTSTDPTYGVTAENPVRVGGPTLSDGPKRERAFLESLRGPDGQRLTYQRRGSCCPFSTPQGVLGAGLLDAYQVTYQGLDKPVTIYINFYDPGPPLAPVGFKPE